MNGTVREKDRGNRTTEARKPKKEMDRKEELRLKLMRFHHKENLF